MKIIFLGFMCVVMSAAAVLAQAPPNDNFTNATVLIGNDITFLATIAGSTLEAGEPTNVPYLPDFAPTQSTWWSWTATESTPVTLAALAFSANTLKPDYVGGQYPCVITVRNATNLSASPFVLWLNSAFEKLSVSFPATAGTTYAIQFLGNHPNLEVSIRLTATNPPVVLDPPTDQTVFTGGSALFTVLAASTTPITYQWQHDGANIPGQTNAMMPLYNIAAQDAGRYSAVLSNYTGVSTSARASLAINDSPAAPLLAPRAAEGSNSFSFNLTAEAGRYYRIESSTNLLNWQFEMSFPVIPFPIVYSEWYSVVYNTNTTISLTIPKNGIAKYVRASLYSPESEACTVNLRQIRFAKSLFARNAVVPSTILFPDLSDLLPYLPSIFSLRCPDNPVPGEYLTNDMVTPPVCYTYLEDRHVLEEP